jgi:hypothetical protein
VPRWLRRVPPWTWLTLTACFVAAVVVVTVTHGGGAPAHRAQSPPSRAAAAHQDEHLALVRDLAFQAGPLPIWIRESTAAAPCPLVRRGTSPRRRISGVVRSVIPRFRVSDIGYTLDPFSGLCNLQLRARDGRGAVVVLSVAGTRYPVRVRDELDTSFVSDGATAVAYAFLVTHDGWQVTVGTAGAVKSLPSMIALRHIAEDRGMRW